MRRALYVERGGMLSEFRQFIARGNLVDLAVAVVIGTAFAAVVTSLVEDLITPLIAAVVLRPVNTLLARARSEQPVDEETRDCPECLSQVPREARRCAFCTSPLSAG